MALSAAEKRKRATTRQRQRRAAEKKAHAAPTRRTTKATTVAKPTAEPGYMAIALGIGAYLEECRAGVVDGKRKPETIQKRIALHEAKLAVAPTAIAEIKERAALLELRMMLERVGLNGNGSAAKQMFIAHAAEWAATNHIPYSVFREMGVKPAVLEEAGISR